ncbi:MAG: PfkB family carbohydrate kinase [Treponema sp.]|jgi:sugar/nucleoside kinase (ribokinase family)|nr:PfkB family carbohydrate kinase [Treponema sp.]
MKTKNELLCFGNAIVDVFADVDSTWLDSHGVKEPVQHISREDAQRLLEELDTPAQAGASARTGVVLSSGGTAANVAKIAAMLNINAAFVGCVGAAPQNLPNGPLQRNGDDLAAIFERDLRDAGVVPILGIGEQKTGLCFAFSCHGETRIAASPGAALELTEDDVREELFDGAEAVMLDGYMLDRRPLVQRILQLANQRGIPIALDAGSVFQIRERTEEILHYSRNYPLIVFMNADESIVFYNNIKKNSDTIEASTEREKETLILREICPVLKYMTEGEIFPIIVIKLGGRGVAVLAGGNIYREETFTIIPRNTVGAGDAFCAAFLSAWIRGKSMRECASLGNKVALKILEVPGTGIKSRKLKSFAKMLRK